MIETKTILQTQKFLVFIFSLMVCLAFGLLIVIHDTSASFPSINILKRLILFIFGIRGVQNHVDSQSIFGPLSYCSSLQFWFISKRKNLDQRLLVQSYEQTQTRDPELLKYFSGQKFKTLCNAVAVRPKLFMNNSYASWYCNYCGYQIYYLYWIDTHSPLIWFFWNGNCLLLVVYQKFICWIEFQSWFNACSWT